MRLSHKQVKTLLNILKGSESSESNRKDACKLFKALVDESIPIEERIKILNSLS